MLRGGGPVRQRRLADRAGRRVKRQTIRAKRARTRLDIAPHEASLWDALRGLRGRLAREQGVPTYVVFHDASLLAMLCERPQALRALGAIRGVGLRKLERYGEAFMAELIR